MAAKPDRAVVRARRGGIHGLASGISWTALAMACAFSSSVSAENYAVSNGNELRDAITAANANTTDPSATITLSASFALTNLPTAVKPITIDTQGFTLSGTPTMSGPSGAGSLTFIGTIAGASGAPASTTAGQVGLLVSGGASAINSGSITGGDGGSGGGQAERGARVYDPNSILINNGTISAGMNYSGTVAISGVTISNGGTLVNNGVIQGAGSQSASALAGSGVDMGTISRSDTLVNTGTIRGGTGTGGALGGAGVTLRLNNQPVVNAGTLEGGNGAVAMLGVGSAKVSLVNSGTLRAGTGQANALQMGTGALTLELQAGSTIQGNVVASSPNVNDILRLGGATNATFDVSLIGAATQYQNFDIFQKTGTGTWSLTGAGTATTNWDIQQGALQIGSGGTTGSIIGNVANAGTLAFDRSNTLTYAGLISGVGAVTQIGSGTTTLTGTNTYTGGTTIAAGTLQLGAGGTTGSILGDVVNNGTLTFSRSDASVFAGAITGTGSVNSISGGTTTLTSNSNYGGGTNASGGGEIRIAGGATVTSGGTSLISAARLTVDGAGTVFNAVTITAQSGGGVASTVNIQNGGVLRTTGNMVVRNSPAGPVLTTLNVSGTGSLADIGGALTVGTSGNTSIAGATVSAGGKMQTAGASTIGAAVGNNTAPFVTITGAGSNWTSASSLTMTNGILSLLNGGAASFTTATIGSVSAARQGAVSVSGANSHLTTSGDLVIGSGAGTGALTLADGGQASVGGSLLLGNGASSTGILNLGGAEGQSAAGTGAFTASALVFGGSGSRINFNHTDPAYSFASLLSGTGAVNQVAGTTVLTADNSYSGTTTISGGTLRINGNQSTATGLTSVLNSGRLGGSGTIGGSVTIANGGTLAPGNSPGTLTIAGDLSLASGSLLDYEFGQSSVVGGPLNDLTAVGGNLTLDGTINVTVTTGGNFDTGVYRILSYGGTLTDNGLALGTLPAGSVVGVQTSIAGQVNLVNSAGATVNFWDGTGPKLDGFVNGGSGVWQNSAGNDNWTDISGTFNNAYNDGAFAIFSAAPGTVTVDNSLGAVTASGMQFVSDGYILTGGNIGLTGSQSVIRVGDGTAAGAAYTATIASALTGTTQLVKTDLGTLVLTGANSYTGGTQITTGTLQIGDGGTSGSLTGAILNNAALVVNRSDAITLDGALSGTGALTKLGAGTLTLTGAGTYTGGTTITAGGLQIGNGGATGSLAGDITNNGALEFNRSGSLSLAGQISGIGSVRQSGSGTTILTGANSYSGATNITAGTLLVNGDQSLATGTTTVSAPATLGGTGIIGGNVDMTAGGTLAAGSNGAGTLTINGNLVLGSSSQLAFELGQTGTAGGALNDLVDVGGNLTLDGTINVTQSVGGNYGAGIYRLITYGGALTNNSLLVGTQPAGAAAFVQTSVANQVNLVNIGGLNLNFWDGAVGPKFDGIINGGSGVWQNSSGNDNWTDANGAINAGYSDGAVAIFAGNAGTVTVDNGLGAVTASGMQFATGGYVITGDALTLTGAQATIRVGDGSAAGAGYTATIASELTGASQLVKTDLGALVLSGANTYSGGTRIDGGTLQIGNGGATGSLTGDIVNNTALAVNRTGTITLDGMISGAGTLNKLGNGLLILTAANSYTGGTTVGGGTVQVSSDANLGNVAGTLSLQGGTLQANAAFTSNRAILLGSPTSNGIDTQGFNVTLAGTISDGASNSAGNFLDKTGLGTLTLTGVNTYANRTVIANGTLALAGAGTIGAGNLVVGAGTVFDISQTNSGARVIQLNSGAAGTIALGSRTLNLGFGSSFSDWSGTITDGGIGGGTGGKVVIAAPGGAVRFFEANSYTGGTTISSGTFVLSGNGSLYSGGAVVMNGGTVFDISGLTGAGATIGDLSGAGAIALGGKSLTFGTGNSTSVSGTISGTGGALVKNGTGTFTLSAANSYSGITDVSAGTLLVNGNQSAATGVTTVASGATLGGIGTLGGNVVVANGGVLAAGSNGIGTLTINGNLALGSTSQLNFDFGQANVVGGALNDLVNIGGNLTLDGTINIATAPGGRFDIGLYRIANYGGALTDNGLAVGTMPAGADVFVQTSVANQVNLINTGGATLNFWDGAAGPKFNNVVNGGDGIWQSGTGNNNWSDASGAVNAGYADGAFAIFTGTAGTVRIDNGLGAVTASGLQFATNGYTINGDALTLTGPQSVIRVGDGTQAGAGYVATIDAALTGTAKLVKTDAGTLVLSGTNSYSGGTLINGGTLRISSDANLGAAAGALSFNGGTLGTTTNIASSRAIDLIGAGTFLTDGATTLTLAGDVSGAGNLTKGGAGTLVLAGAGSHTLGTSVNAGTLLINGNYAAATGVTSVASGATLGGTGTIGGNVTLADGAALSPGAGGAGRLTINGDLSLASGTQLAFELGQGNTAGGTLNDLVTVGGDLILDGTINVSVPTGGAFDVGVYRVFNYGGALTNNGLTLGTLPGGSAATVQTSITGQVNLVNSAGLTLNFWDGLSGPKNNGIINGGTGVWQTSTGNDNWADASGAVNAAYSDAAFAVFGGTGGIVTVDNGLGNVTASGMQFAANGYTIVGSTVTLTGPQSTIRVGDGTASGTGFTATISSALNGATQLVKTDLGTLVLSGANTYTGGTLVNGGTLQISADANLGAVAGGVTLDGGTLASTANLTSARDIAVAGPGVIATASSTTFTLGGALSGNGAWSKTGTGTLVLAGNSGAYTGATTVASGTLAVQGTLGGNMTVGTEGRLEGTGQVGSVTNSGIIAPGGEAFGTLTVAGSYAGSGGTLEIAAALGNDSSQSSRLIVNGATSGTTQVEVLNRNGMGGQTIEGVKIIDVTGASNGTFVLDGDYVFDGEQAVIAGAYGYRLYKNGVANPADGDWYLRSALLIPGDTDPSPLYQPGVPIYEVYGANLLSLNTLPTLQQRVGNRTWAAGDGSEGNGLWGRTEGMRSRANAAVSTSGSDQDTDIWKMQLGADQLLTTTDKGGRLVTGITVTYGEARSHIRSNFGNGAIKTNSYALGATMTWYGLKGEYIDGQAQVSYYDSNLDSDVLGALAHGNGGSGEAISFEAGKRVSMSGKLSVTPQFQMAYSNLRFDRFVDEADAVVTTDKGASLKTRWGVTLDRQSTGSTGDSHVYGLVNLTYEWLDGTRTRVSGTAINHAEDRLWGELGMGGTINLGTNLTLYGEAVGKTALKEFGNSYSLEGSAGLRLRF